MDIMVLAEYESKRRLVGTLKRSADDFVFTYEKAWVRNRSAIALGPDLPLHPRTYRSRELFDAFKRRIPPRDSENYERYCFERGIHPQETDLFVLLGTIAHAGASTFVFEIDRSKERHSEVLEFFAKLIEDYSYEIISLAFSVNKTGLYKLLKGQVAPGNSSLYELLELCYHIPEAAHWKINSSLFLPDRQKKTINEHLKKLFEKTLKSSSMPSKPT